MQVIANVDEADIGGVKEGDRANVNFTVDGILILTMYSRETVKQVRLEATTTNNVFKLRARLSSLAMLRKDRRC